MKSRLRQAIEGVVETYESRFGVHEGLWGPMDNEIIELKSALADPNQDSYLKMAESQSFTISNLQHESAILRRDFNERGKIIQGLELALGLASKPPIYINSKGLDPDLEANLMNWLRKNKGTVRELLGI